MLGATRHAHTTKTELRKTATALQAITTSGLAAPFAGWTRAPFYCDLTAGRIVVLRENEPGVGIQQAYALRFCCAHKRRLNSKLLGKSEVREVAQAVGHSHLTCARRVQTLFPS